MARHSTGSPSNLNGVVTTSQSHVIDCNGLLGVSVHVVASDVAITAKTFTDTEVDLDTEDITIEDHGYITGTRVVASTSDTLPTGLTATTYYVIKIDDDTIQLASSLANAVAGTEVNITEAGVGTHTLTPATAASNTLALYKSNDGTNYIAVTSGSVTIADSDINSMIEVANPTYRWLKLLYTPSAGQINLATIVTTVS